MHLQLAAVLTAAHRLLVTVERRAHQVSALAGAVGRGDRIGVVRVGPGALPVKKVARAGRRLRLGTFSTFGRDKRFDALLDCFRIVHARRPDAELVILGDLGADSDPRLRAFRRAIAEHPAAANIRTPGKQDLATIAGEIAELDVYLFPMHTGANTRSSTLPVALGTGLPVVRSGCRDRRPVRRRRQRDVRRSAVGRFVREGGARAGGTETIWPSGSRRARWRCTTHICAGTRSAISCWPRSTGNLVARHDEEPVRLEAARSTPPDRRTASSLSEVIARPARRSGIRSGTGATAARARMTERTSARMNPQPMKYSACQMWSNVRLPDHCQHRVRQRRRGGASTPRPFQEFCRRATARPSIPASRSRRAGYPNVPSSTRWRSNSCSTSYSHRDAACGRARSAACRFRCRAADGRASRSPAAAARSGDQQVARVASPPGLRTGSARRGTHRGTRPPRRPPPRRRRPRSAARCG